MSETPARDFIDDDEIDLRELFGLFYARKFTIIAITFLATLIGVAYALVSVPVYQADALVQLEEKSSGGLALSSELTDMLGGTAPQSVAEIEIIKSRMILGSVVEELNLDQTATPKRLPVIGNFLTRYTLPDPGWGFLSSYAWHDEAITLGALSVPDAMLGEPITLTYLGNDAFTVDLDTGSLISGKVGEKLQDPTTGFALLIDELSGAAGREFFITQNAPANVVKNLRSNLSISEKGKNSAILQLTLKGENRTEAARILDRITEVYLLQNLTRNVAEAESSLAFIRQQLPEAKTSVTNAEGALNAFKLSQDSVDLSFETRSLLEQAVQIEAQLNALMLEEQELQKRYTQSHPVYQTLLDNRSQLDDRLAEIRNQTVDLPETQQEMLRLSQDLEVAQEIYLQLVGRAQELNVVKAGTIGNIRIIDTAEALTIPVAPNKKMIVLLSMVLGGVAALGYVLLRSFLSRGIDSTDDIEQLGIPVYASVNKVGNGSYGGTGNKANLKILANEDPTSLAVEALRSLRTSLHFGMLDAETSLLVITSARPAEGKTFISVNLATVMAKAGQNVCLVDADLRRGYLRRFFGIDKSAPGLTDVLAGDALIEDVIQLDEATGLHFLPSGKYPPNPSELLMNKAFGDVLEYLDKRFDLTILDTPPVLAVTDPVIIGKYAGMILLAVQYHVTNVAEIKAVQKVFDTNDLKITGAVFNGYDAKKSAYGYAATSYQYEYKPRKP